MNKRPSISGLEVTDRDSYTGQRILLVDDEPTVLAALRLTLEANGFVCNTAADGLEALKALAETSVDVVISDLRMPNMSGFELLPNIRRRHPQVVLIVCSAEPGDDLHSLNLPADAYLQKGAYTPEQLLTTIDLATHCHWSL